MGQCRKWYFSLSNIFLLNSHQIMFFQTVDSSFISTSPCCFFWHLLLLQERPCLWICFMVPLKELLSIEGGIIFMRCTFHFQSLDKLNDDHSCVSIRSWYCNQKKKKKKVLSNLWRRWQGMQTKSPAKEKENTRTKISFVLKSLFAGYA